MTEVAHHKSNSIPVSHAGVLLDDSGTSQNHIGRGELLKLLPERFTWLAAGRITHRHRSSFAVQIAVQIAVRMRNNLFVLVATGGKA